MVSYGKPVFRGAEGSLWQHDCGFITAVDLMADDPRQPWERGCGSCHGSRPNDWRPLFAYTGPWCDQCDGNGWVPISGKIHGAICGYDTVTECSACDGSGMAQ